MSGEGDPDEAAATQVDGAAQGERQEAVIVGRFVLGRCLGSGGMGDVYEAYDPVLERTVAMKVLRPRASADSAAQARRVLSEARAAARLAHPNTVTIFDVGEHDGRAYITMELLEGETLRAAAKHAPLEKKLGWLLESARALVAAHENGLVHRDVKPENMFVCADGTLKLLDFGIAKREEDETMAPSPASVASPNSLRTELGKRIGTPRYMAPEQRAGAPTDARTDQYAWGLVAFELLTGAHLDSVATIDDSPIGDDRAQEIRERSLTMAAMPAPPAYVAAVLRALSDDKARRFDSMQPIVEALQAARPPEPDAARPPAEVSGHRRAVRVAAVVVMLGAIAIAVALAVVTVGKPAEQAVTLSPPPEIGSVYTVVSYCTAFGVPQPTKLAVRWGGWSTSETVAAPPKRGASSAAGLVLRLGHTNPDSYPVTVTAGPSRFASGGCRISNGPFQGPPPPEWNDERYQRVEW